MDRVVLSLLLATVLACFGSPAVQPEPGTAYERSCPQAVRIFATEEMVGKAYHEVALLGPTHGTGLVDQEVELKVQRERAADMGANGLILDATERPGAGAQVAGTRLGDARQRAEAAVAIYIPEDAASTRGICAGADVNLARAADRATADALGYAIQGSATAEPAEDSTEAAGAPVKPEAAVEPDTIGTADVEARAEMARRLGADRSMREALSDVIRLRIVSEYHEVRPGVLALTLDEGYGTATSLEYNLLRLYHAYRGVLYYQLPAVLELWRDGRKIGEFTRGGLFLDPDPARAR